MGKITSDGIFLSLGKIRSKTSMSRHWRLFQAWTWLWKPFCPLSFPASSLEWRAVCACFLQRYNLLMRFEWRDNWLLACLPSSWSVSGVFNDTCLNDGSREKRYLDLSVSQVCFLFRVQGKHILPMTEQLTDISDNIPSITTVFASLWIL